jgi:PiT family inorganic phosphate transporter
LTSSGTAAVLVLAASVMALPVSTTHVVTGAIVGSGLSGGVRAIKWGTLGSIVLAWLVTLPVAAGFAALAVWAMRQ